MSGSLVLAPESVEAVAQRVAELLREDKPAATALVDASAVAEALGVSRDTVYARASELGARRIGDGPRARLRFDLEQARAAWTSCEPSERSQPAASPAAKRDRRPRRRRTAGTGVDLLPVRGS